MWLNTIDSYSVRRVDTQIHFHSNIIQLLFKHSILTPPQIQYEGFFKSNRMVLVYKRDAVVKNFWDERWYYLCIYRSGWLDGWMAGWLAAFEL